MRGHLRKRRPAGTPLRRMVFGALLASALVQGCGRRRADHAHSLALPVNVLADTAHAAGGRIAFTPTLPMPPETAPGSGSAWEARVWMARVSPRRSPAIVPPLPSAEPESLSLPNPAPPMLDVDADLKPPLPRTTARLTVPRGARPASVELDVRVDEQGEVSDAEWASGSSDSLLVEAAVRCALGMRFYPALIDGRPIAVWCRQRFDFTRHHGAVEH